MQKIKLEKQTVVFFVLLVILAVEVFVLLPGRVKSAVILNKRISATRRQLREIKRDWPNKQKYLEVQSGLKKEVESIKAKIVSVDQESKLLSFISTGSKQFGVEIEALLPGKLSSLSGAPSTQLKYLPINIKAKSRCYGLMEFLKYLQASDYFFEIKSLSIKSGYPYNSIEVLVCAVTKEK